MTTPDRLRRAACALLAVAALAACGADSPAAPGGATQPEAQLTFLRPASTTPALARDSVVIWAVRGRDREGAIFYRPRAGRSDSTELLHFKVSGNTVLRRPDGSLVARGDSVRIVIRVRDLARYVFEFQPAGLRFESRPAELEIEWGDSDQDFNRDGRVDAADRALVQRFRIWRQEGAGQPWVSLTSRLKVDTEELEADVPGFSNHAIAY